METKPELGPHITYSPDKGGGGGGPEFDPLREGREYFYVEPSFVSVLNRLKRISRLDSVLTRANTRLAGEKDPERISRLQEGINRASEQLRNLETGIPKDYNRLMAAQLNEIQGMLDYQLLRFKSPYPYDSRRQEMWFENLHDALQKAHQEDWPPEGSPQRTRVEAWLGRIATDTTWGEANFRLLEGLGSVLPAFYDGKKMMQWVSVPLRSDPVASFYEQTFAEKLPGLELNDAERGILPEEAKKGLREQAIAYQNDCAYWRIAIASVQQIDHEGQESTPMEKLSPAEIEFMRRVFNDHNPAAEADAEKKLIEEIREKEPDQAEALIQKIATLRKGDGWYYYDKSGTKIAVPGSMLNWHSMDMEEGKKRRYLAIMETLLSGEVRGKLQELEAEADGKPTFDPTKMDELIQTVNGEVENRLNNWYSPRRTLKSRLAGVVARAGIVMDWGHMCSAEMSWGWNYSLKLVDHDLKVVRSKVMGGTTVATDANTPAYWRENEMNNQRRAWAKGYLPPMSASYIAELQKHSPGWKPPFTEEILNQDPRLKYAWSRLWASDRGIEWNPKIKKLLQGMVWNWETPIQDPKVIIRGKDGEEQPISLAIPFFFPPEITSLNFWNTISLQGDKGIKLRVAQEGSDMVIKPGRETVWDQLRRKEDMSKLDWIKMGDQALYRWMITIGQTVRYIVTMLDSEMVAKDQIEAFFSNPDALKELLKRSDLGERDEQIPMTTLTISLVPMLVVLRSAQKHGILGPAGLDKDRRGLWAREIAQWIAAFRDLPVKREEADHYGEYMARMVKFYTVLIARAGMVEGQRVRLAAQNAYTGEIAPELAQVGANISDQIITSLPPIERR